MRPSWMFFLISPSASIEPDHLPREIADTSVPIVDGQTLPDIEREARDAASRVAIYRALERAGWNIKEGAKLLGVPDKTLYDKCSRLGIKLRGMQASKPTD